MGGLHSCVADMGGARSGGIVIKFLSCQDAGDALFDELAVGREIIAMGGDFRFERTDDAKACHEFFTDGIHVMNQQVVAETAGQDDHGGAKTIVLLQDCFRGEHTCADGGDAAEAVGHSFHAESHANLLDCSVGQQFEHEFLSIAEAQVIEADEHFIDARQGCDFIQIRHGIRRLEEKYGPAAAVDGFQETGHFICRFEIRQHDDVCSGLDDGINLLLRGTVVSRRIMDGIATHKQFGFRQDRTDIADVLHCVVALHRIHAALTGGLANVFHIDEDTVHASSFRDFGNFRFVRDVEKFQWHYALSCFRKVSPLFSLSALTRTLKMVMKKIFKSSMNEQCSTYQTFNSIR